MYACQVCNKTFKTKLQLGGHRGAHTRRKEAPPVIQSVMNGTCPDCNLTFQTSQKLAGHRRLMHTPWDLFKTDIRRKSRLLKERGHKCEICSTTTWMEKLVPIQLEHIDGNPNNSSKENLRLICPNCHAQTDTYCGKNMGRPKCLNREKAKYPAYRDKRYIDRQLNKL